MESWASKSYHDYLHKTLKQPKGNIFNVHGEPLGPFPTSGDRVPTGYKIVYELAYDPNDPSGTVVGATFTVVNKHGQKSSGRQLIRNYKIWTTNTSVPPRAMAPIYALQLNLVGESNGRYMFIRSGAGTITYEATVPLTPEGTQPATAAATRAFTKESSNIRYAELGVASNQKIIQKFRAAKSH